MNETTKRSTSRIILPCLVIISLFVSIGCVPMALTGWTNWIERQYLSPLDQPKTFKIAKQAMARVGTISYSDQDIGSINGTCGQGLDATIQVTENKEGTLVLIKSRLNETGTTWVGANHREKCIEKIATEMKNLGVSLIKRKQ